VLARRGALVSTSTLVFYFFLFFLDGENPLSVPLFLRIWGKNDRSPLIPQSDTGQLETSEESIVEICITRLDIFDRRVYFRNAHPPTNKSQQSSPSLPNHRGGVLFTHTPPLRNALPER